MAEAVARVARITNEIVEEGKDTLGETSFVQMYFLLLSFYAIYLKEKLWFRISVAAISHLTTRRRQRLTVTMYIWLNKAKIPSGLE